MTKGSSQISFSGRASALRQSRNLKMAGSAHAYIRGNTLKFYEWLAASDSSKVPQGPPIWICGDCHVGNLGPIADTDGQIDIEIRDLDQTVIGNPAHDLIRLGLSLATAARGSDLPGVTTAKMLEQMVEGYEEALVNKDPDLRSQRPECVRIVMRQRSGGPGNTWLKSVWRIPARRSLWASGSGRSARTRDVRSNAFLLPRTYVCWLRCRS